MMQHSILIVGAGPTGLTLAIELARRNIPYRIIDKLPIPTHQSRALGIHARTLEVFADMGVVDAILQHGDKMQTLTIHAKQKTIAEIQYGRVESSYPFAIILPQTETEAVLTKRLHELGGAVERECELINFSVTTNTVRATLHDKHGQTETIETPYLIGCDGAHSTVRHQLNLPFSGDATDESWILADVQIDMATVKETFGLFLDAQGLLLLAPMGHNQ
nr:monooxygenase [Legionellales bacterium]